LSLTNEQKEKIIEFRNKNLGYHLIANKLELKRDQVRGFCTRTNIGISMNLGGTKSTIKNKKEYECKHCKKKFYKNDSEINSTIYCSSKCKKNENDKRKRETNEKKIHICKKCGKEFIRKNSELYCDTCKIIKKVCPVCGKEFTIKRGKNLNQICCNNKCSAIYTRKTHE
jgi:hypothetical protein